MKRRYCKMCNRATGPGGGRVCPECSRAVAGMRAVSNRSRSLPVAGQAERVARYAAMVAAGRRIFE